MCTVVTTQAHQRLTWSATTALPVLAQWFSPARLQRMPQAAADAAAGGPTGCVAHSSAADFESRARVSTLVRHAYSTQAGDGTDAVATSRAPMQLLLLLLRLSDFVPQEMVSSGSEPVKHVARRVAQYIQWSESGCAAALACELSRVLCWQAATAEAAQLQQWYQCWLAKLCGLPVPPTSSATPTATTTADALRAYGSVARCVVQSFGQVSVLAGTRTGKGSVADGKLSSTGVACLATLRQRLGYNKDGDALGGKLGKGDSRRWRHVIQSGVPLSASKLFASSTDFYKR